MSALEHVGWALVILCGGALVVWMAADALRTGDVQTMLSVGVVVGVVAMIVGGNVGGQR